MVIALPTYTARTHGAIMGEGIFILNIMDTMQIGNITELKIQTAFVEKGYHVFTPITDGSSVDLIFINENNIAKKVQIKTSVETATGFRIDTRKATSSSRVRKKSYEKDEIDFFATVFKADVYIVPINIASSYSMITLRIDKEYKNGFKPVYAEDYLL